LTVKLAAAGISHEEIEQELNNNSGNLGQFNLVNCEQY